MKRFVWVVTVVLLIFSLTSCSETVDSSDASEYQASVDNISSVLTGNVPPLFRVCHGRERIIFT